jgi:galactosylceramidase
MRVVSPLPLQFAEPGWRYLDPTSTGMGALPGNGTYVTVFNPRVANRLEMSLVLQTTKATAAQSVTFQLAGAGTGRELPPTLHVWRTTQSAYFEQLADVFVDEGGSFTLELLPDAIYSVTTTTGQGRAQPSAPVPSSSPFPFPYADSFDGYAESGAWEFAG